MRNTVTRRAILGVIMLLVAQQSPAFAQAGITPAEVRAIAKEAYVYGFPMVDSYRVQHAYFVDVANKEYKGPWNTLVNTPRVYTPADTTVQTPNSDTPYSFAGLDLRAEPMVFTVPPIESNRYYSVQLIDAFTHNFDYVGSRTTGNGGGSYLIVGPGWSGVTPPGIKKLLRSETDFVLPIIRTQLFNPADLDNVKKVQAGYKLQPLSAFLGRTAPVPAPQISFIKPLTPGEQKSSIEFFNVLNFAMQFATTHPSEKALMVRFSKIGVGGGKVIDANSLSPETKAALQAGMADAWSDFATFKKQKLDAGLVTSGDIFGTRAFLNNNYMYRMAAAVLGLYGNSKQEAMYPMYLTDAGGQMMSGANKYILRFPPGQLPPVNAFWSLTMYKMPESLLVDNPIDRYLLNSPMLSQMTKDVDGGLTLYVQNQSPGKDKESNWLPAPAGPFVSAMRLYWPKDTALEGKWKAPAITKVQ